MCLAFCTLYVERGATPALHLKGRKGGEGGEGGRGQRRRGFGHALESIKIKENYVYYPSLHFKGQEGQRGQ